VLVFDTGDSPEAAGENGEGSKAAAGRDVFEGVLPSGVMGDFMWLRNALDSGS